MWEKEVEKEKNRKERKDEREKIKSTLITTNQPLKFFLRIFYLLIFC